MPFDYDKLKSKQVQNDSSWTSNSDLFMVLSLVFLLLYVISSLRNGSSAVQKTIQYKELKKRNQDLEQQILAYEALKEDYLKKEASKSEMNMYGELMDKLTLLKEEAKEEKNDLRERALENEKKERALNKYQQLVRNIVNTNLLAQKRINKRDKKIEQKDQVIVERDQTIVERDDTIQEKEVVIAKNNRTISSQQKDIERKIQDIARKKQIIAETKKDLAKRKVEIKNLEKVVSTKKSEIRRNNKKINKINNQLDRQIAKLKKEQKKHKFSKKVLNSKISNLKRVKKKQIRKLENVNKKARLRLKKVNTSLASVEGRLEEANNVIAVQKTEQADLDKEVKKTTQKLAKNRALYKKRVVALRRQHKEQLQSEQEEFEQSLRQQKLSTAEQKRRLSQYKKQAKVKEQELSSKIGQLNTEIKDVSSQLNQTIAEKKRLASNLKKSTKRFKKDLSKLKSNHARKIAREKKAFNKSLRAQRLSAKGKAAKLRAFKAKIAKEERNLKSKLAGLNSKIRSTQGKLANAQSGLSKAQKEKGRYLSSITNLKSKNTRLSGDLKKAQSQIDTRRKVAKRLAASLKKKGIKASVNLKTGDVTMAFGKEYFDAGKANLKNGMKGYIKKFIPEYSESLFSDPKIANKIEAVEIIGFASPTYRGKFVNPESLDSADQKAVQYNLRLSQSRANSVFDYIFDKKKINYKHQEKLYPKVKVTGRSFLSNEIKNAKQYEGMSHRKFCKKYDCRKAQRVIVKFSLKN
jgi:chromosome segregation ATPase